MQTEFSLVFLLENKGCYEKKQIIDLYPKDKETVSYKDIINCDIHLNHKFWFFNKKVFTLEQNKKLAILLAESILPIYEKEFPDCKAPRKCIEVAKSYLKGEITLKELRTKRVIMYDVACTDNTVNGAARGAARTIYNTICTFNAATCAAANNIETVKLILQKFIEDNK